MVILFENYQYKIKDIYGLIPDWMIKSCSQSDIIDLPYVGYIYSSKLSDIIFFLPKIFIFDNNMAFGSVAAEKLLSQSSFESLHDSIPYERLYTLSMQIYESIKKYNLRVAENRSIFNDTAASGIISFKKGTSRHTIMEIYFSFVNFYKKNSFLFVRRTRLASNGKKTSWNKTVNKTVPIIQNKKPIYFERKSYVSFLTSEDELIILFFSVLKYFSRCLGFRFNYEYVSNLIEGSKFNSLLEGKGLIILKKIKNSYFSDVFISLWHLLYMFFDTFSKINLDPEYEEALLSKNFPAIFEDMVDSLICDNSISNNIPLYFKEQKDGKIVDHIYKDRDLFSDAEIYFIGDSKYYKSGTFATGMSVEKQFTYARNVIQYSCDPNRSNTEVQLRYRDSISEGYNITPNFFISAVIDNNFNSTDDNINRIGFTESRCQFKNRLFDRDTMFVHRYSLNFLYVLSSYISNDFVAKGAFRHKARARFRSDIIDYINRNYYLYRVYADTTSSIEDIIKLNFRSLVGKVYSLQNESCFFIYASEKNQHWHDYTHNTPDIIDAETIKNYLSSLKGVETVTEFKLT